MNVGLAALEVVVQVVPEQVDQVDGVVPGVLVGVAGEQDKGDVANTLASTGICVLQTHRRFPNRIKRLPPGKILVCTN